MRKTINTAEYLERGAEAEALRVAFELLTDKDEISGEDIMDILDRIDAGEALSHLEAVDRAVQDKVAQVEKKARTSMIALESLTCGGSEYVGDVDRCVEYIRHGQESMRRGFGKKIEIEKERAEAAETRLATVRYHLIAWNKSVSRCSGDVKEATLNDIEEVVK